MKLILLILASVYVTGCSVVGQSDVENAPYTLIQSAESQQIEVRNYESMVLVSTSMLKDGRNSAFRKLFAYIGGDNEGSTEIAMTAPVFMDDSEQSNNGTEISMTAPVLMNEGADESVMSFVMPKEFTLQTTPKPSNPEVMLSELNNYKVAAIEFSGTMSDSNLEKHTEILKDWIKNNGYTAVSEPITAGYNGPLTLPWFRKNEILIEVQ
jgi:hypothetical protein